MPVRLAPELRERACECCERVILLRSSISADNSCHATSCIKTIENEDLLSTTPYFFLPSNDLSEDSGTFDRGDNQSAGLDHDIEQELL